MTSRNAHQIDILRSKIDKVDLLVYKDALLKAMCKVAQLRNQESREVAFGIGENRVAPIKIMLVGNLEMQAAVNGVRLLEVVLNEIDIELDQIVH